MDTTNSGTRSVVLASASPRRRGFLHQLGYHFEVVTPATEEKARPGEIPTDYVLRNAQEKSADVAGRVAAGAVVIAADTVVVLRGRIMEKPRSERDAHEMLHAIGVSSDALDALVAAAHDAGAIGAKLTGGGLGGCIIALAHSARSVGLDPCFLTRGHGGRLKGPILVNIDKHTASDVGDEA